MRVLWAFDRAEFMYPDFICSFIYLTVNQTYKQKKKNNKKTGRNRSRTRTGPGPDHFTVPSGPSTVWSWSSKNWPGTGPDRTVTSLELGWNAIIHLDYCSPYVDKMKISTHGITVGIAGNKDPLIPGELRTWSRLRADDAQLNYGTLFTCTHSNIIQTEAIEISSDSLVYMITYPTIRSQKDALIAGSMWHVRGYGKLECKPCHQLCWNGGEKCSNPHDLVHDTAL